ncbi:hypothetical protein ACFSQU_03020 [Massilia sp. GCM10020059]|uniref:Alpha/beta hydrolase n=1 Tax=Massilia agrisoli TaxID=2892444 RepID=A0ABS8IRK4_9BURK|nr:hypothetical protein [Massilia agrisoli]MCC6069889.1 hypothetical protein [Massilia agrisoli]
MKKLRTIARAFILLTTVAYSLGAAAKGHRTQVFTTVKTANAETVHGQIDWPQGELIDWNGPVIVFISGGIPSDRNGWAVLARGTVWNRRSPFKDLSDALVAKGMAVIRFDHPAVRAPKFNCRDALENGTFSESRIRTHCLNVEVLSRVGVSTYVSSVEAAINHVVGLMPNATRQVVLFGFSEGLQHATTILNRRSITPSALVSIGSPAQCLRDVSHWQAIDRVIETLPEFDSNIDGVVTNAEIEDGYKRGIGGIASDSSAWLSPHGEWRKDDIEAFRSDLKKQFSELTGRFRDVGQKDSLTYVRHKSGVRIPDVTESFWRMQFQSEVSSLKSMVQLGVPGLFIWGDKDRQVPVTLQASLAVAAKQKGATVEVVRFAARFHMLSAESDTDWFEPAFASDIAEVVRKFLLRSRRSAQAS